MRRRKQRNYVKRDQRLTALPPKKSLLDRLKLEGDLPARVLAWAVPACPFFLQPVFVTAYTLIFFFIAEKPRRAVQANLATLEPDESPIGIWWNSFLVFLNFAWTCVDTERASEDAGALRWEIEGAERFDQAAKLDSGLLVLTAHMGSYDVAASVFADRFGEKKLHAVRAPEPTDELQKFRRQSLEQTAGGGLSIAYNTTDGFLGIDLVRALANGDAVAIQGDRVMYDVAPSVCKLRDSVGDPIKLQVPKGPFVLAMASKVPILPVFVVRIGSSQFRVICGEMFICERTGRDKEFDLQRAINRWGLVLEKLLREHSSQWYVFEDAFVEDTPGPGGDK